MATIALAGHVCADLTPELTQKTDIQPGELFQIGPLRLTAGGCVANTGSALAELGIPVTISGTVGNDHLGSVLRQLLADRGLDPQGMAVTSSAATSYSIVIEKPGINRTFWHHVGANTMFDGHAVVLDDCDLLHVGYPPLLPGLTVDTGAPLVALLSRAREREVSTSIDMAVVDERSAAAELDWPQLLQRVLPLTDVFSPSIDDLTSALRLTREQTDDEIAALADDLVAQGAGIVVLSAGERGLFLKAAPAARLAHGGRVVAPLARRWAGAQLWLPAVPVGRVATTNGAGDAATAGLLSGLVAGLDPRDALSCGLRAAASRVTAAGP